MMRSMPGTSASCTVPSTPWATPSSCTCAFRRPSPPMVRLISASPQPLNRSAPSPGGTVVVNKSTVPVGSTLLVERALGRADFRSSQFEFLREEQRSTISSTPIGW